MIFKYPAACGGVFHFVRAFEAAEKDAVKPVSAETSGSVPASR